MPASEIFVGLGLAFVGQWTDDSTPAYCLLWSAGRSSSSSSGTYSQSLVHLHAVGIFSLHSGVLKLADSTGHFVIRRTASYLLNHCGIMCTLFLGTFVGFLNTESVVIVTQKDGIEIFFICAYVADMWYTYASLSPFLHLSVSAFAFCLGLLLSFSHRYPLLCHDIFSS